SLRACVSFSFTVNGRRFMLAGDRRLDEGTPLVGQVQLAVTITCAIGGGLGLFLYAIGCAFATTISEGGLRGPTMWGSGTMIGWNEIASVRRVTVKGLPYSIVRSRSSNKEVWLCILGFDDSIVLDRLQAFAERDEPSHKVSDNLLTLPAKKVLITRPSIEQEEHVSVSALSRRYRMAAKYRLFKRFYEHMFSFETEI